ncbi:MarR family winged helix-turn-helix transcriptional regulator [Marinomonas fungiae]|uniref:DNA-binding transcriptional regulator, MarR family n=1 Tax=Marinomonas fungiae TaxID=1137284 RepID=A0A0K6IG32_9GAMM|nr:MarR family transcriptional regulator [Marinomonas fungiae]CUB02322.1 DNA-binding transcriptional regulator, MarR family [Marinomonas fungiae]
MPDHVAKLLQQWQTVRPELDTSPMGIIGRIGRMEKFLLPEIESIIHQHGMTRIEFDLMATLRRANGPLTPTDLYKTTMLSSGAVSSKLDKLVEKQWVKRLVNEEDRRSCRVVLTKEGLRIIDPAVDAHLENQKKLLESLTFEEQQTLGNLLAKWLGEYENQR